MENATNRNLNNRKAMVRALRAEVVGPDPQGASVERLPFTISPEEAYEQYSAIHQLDGEEILTKDLPARRYGAGVLYPPQEIAIDPSEKEPEEAEVEDQTKNGKEEVREEKGEKVQKRIRSKAFGTEDDDFPITAANSFKQSAMGMSFVVNLAALGDTNHITVRVASHGRVDSSEVDESLWVLQGS